MIDLKKYEDDLINLGGQYFVKDIRYIPDLMSWAKETDQGLAEPYSAMKLIANPELVRDFCFINVNRKKGGDKYDITGKQKAF